MKLENQVCTWGQAIKLRELGVAGESALFWTELTKGRRKIIPSTSTNTNSKKTIAEIWLPAFTVAELGEMLSAYSQIGHSFRYIGTQDWWHTWQKYGKAQPNMGPFPTEAQARAALLIHLLEKKYLTPSEVNARLEQNDKE